MAWSPCPPQRRLRRVRKPRDKPAIALRAAAGVLTESSHHVLRWPTILCRCRTFRPDRRTTRMVGMTRTTPTTRRVRKPHRMRRIRAEIAATERGR